MRNKWTELPMSQMAMDQVLELGKKQTAIEGLCFYDRNGNLVEEHHADMLQRQRTVAILFAESSISRRSLNDAGCQPTCLLDEQGVQRSCWRGRVGASCSSRRETAKNGANSSEVQVEPQLRSWSSS